MRMLINVKYYFSYFFLTTLHALREVHVVYSFYFQAYECNDSDFFSFSKPRPSRSTVMYNFICATELKIEKEESIFYNIILS